MILNIDEKKTYVIGVSGGPDSMALLDMCQKQGIFVAVAHMNYAKRDSAKRDEEIVRNYCEKYGIPYVIRMQNKQCIGNFQAFARDERYAFYKELIQTYDAEAVLLAHHLDDHLETYLMQMQRRSTPQYFGISEHACIMDCQIIRPLLMYTKQELLNYCDEYHIPYGIDESNLTNDYTRNKIRHTLIEPMVKQKKWQLLNEIAEKNISWERKQKEIEMFLNTWDGEISSIQKYPLEERCHILFFWIKQHTGIAVSAAEQEQIAKQAMHTQAWIRPIKQTHMLYASYGRLEIDERLDEGYSYQYDKLTYITTPFFQIVEKGTTIQGVTLSEHDFPITIRNAKEGDAILLRFGKKRVHRWFIDRKISWKKRKKWPVLVNAVGNVIFVPGIGCDIEHFSNNPNAFVLE